MTLPVHIITSSHHHIISRPGEGMIANVAVAGPGSTRMLAGTAATAGLLLASVTDRPLGPATPRGYPASVTCPRATCPPGTKLGKRTSPRAVAAGGGTGGG